MLSNTFLGKNADIYHNKKFAKEKSTAGIIIHIVTNDLCSDKEPNNIANDIMQLVNLLNLGKNDTNKVGVFSILTF